MKPLHYRDLGLSQGDFAELTGVNRSTVNRWFRGEVPVIVQRVIDLLNDLAPRQRAKYIKPAKDKRKLGRIRPNSVMERLELMLLARDVGIMLGQPVLPYIPKPVGRPYISVAPTRSAPKPASNHHIAPD